MISQLILFFRIMIYQSQWMGYSPLLGYIIINKIEDLHVNPFIQQILDIEMAEEVKSYALLGDVGGTNIRLELVELSTTSKAPISTLKKSNLNVADHELFSNSIRSFLEGVPQLPSIAVIGIAGPIFDNTVSLANVPKWGTLIGDQLAKELNILSFRFINDFEAASYGLLLLEKQDFISLNGLQTQDNKMRGILGPGTGLGNSLLYPARIKNLNQTFVLPSEGGHTDFPTIDSETADFFAFLVKETPYKYISLERSFCGPTIPMMFKFAAQRYPEDAQVSEIPTPEKIVSVGVGADAPRIYKEAVDLLIKIYSAAIGNFITTHVCLGGLYLVGSLTNSLLPRLEGVDILKGFRDRHPEVEHLVKKAPLLVCKEIDLGLKGAFYVARSILKNI